MKLLIADDHSLVADAICLLLTHANPAIKPISVASAGQACIVLEDEGPFDALVADLRMPGMNDDETRSKLMRLTRHCPNILISGHANLVDLQDAKLAGFNAYIPKSYIGEQFYRALMDTVVNFKADPNWFEDFSKKYNWVDRKISPREHDIVNLLKEGMSNKEIARAADLSPETVKAHIKTLLLKFGAKNRTEVVVRAIEDGLI
ncbi:MAG: response regulator transcription factor [Henriciella sp.]|nr:response regulator transcription factor [Henriciella sp.]